MVNNALLSEKGLKVIKDTSLAAASRLAIIGDKEKQHELFNWTHSPARLSKKTDEKFEEVEEAEFVDEILRFSDIYCKRTFFMVSPQGTGKSEACINVKHAFEKKFAETNYPPVLYVQRDAPAIKFLNADSEMAKWLGQEIIEEYQTTLKVFGEKDNREDVLNNIIEHNFLQKFIDNMRSNLVTKASFEPFSNINLNAQILDEFSSILNEHYAPFLASHFQSSSYALEFSVVAEPRSKFFDPKDNSSESVFRNFVSRFRRAFRDDITRSQVIDLLNASIDEIAGGETPHLSDAISTIGNIARRRKTHLLVIFEDFFADLNSEDTEKYGNMITSDMSPEEEQKDNITLLFAGLRDGIKGLRQKSHAKTSRIHGEYRTAKGEEEGDASLVVKNPVDFARRYILWAKRDEGLIDNYDINDKKRIKSPDRNLSDWNLLSPLNQQLFPLSDKAIRFIWENLINQNPREFLDFIRQMFDATKEKDSWHPPSRTQLFYKERLKEDWYEIGDGFNDTIEYIFHYMYGPKDQDFEVLRNIFKLDEWDASKLVTITIVEEPEIQSHETTKSLLRNWKSGGKPRKKALPKIHDYELKVWERILLDFFDSPAQNTRNQGINYELPGIKRVILRKKFTITKPRGAEGDSNYDTFGLNLDAIASGDLNRTDYRETVVRLGSALSRKEEEWPDLNEIDLEIISEIVERISVFIENNQLKIQSNIKFEDLEKQMMALKIFEGMWLTLIEGESISYTPDGNDLKSWFEKGYNSETDCLEKTLDILQATEHDILGEWSYAKTAMADHGKLKQSLGRLNDKGAEAKSFFKEIYECNIKNQEWWDQFAETDGGDDGWLNYILLNRAEFINELSNWNFVAKREASRADKGRISLWVEFWYLFANQWFKRRHRPPQKNLEEFSFFFALYSEAMTSTSSWDAKIKKLKDSGVEKDLRKSWKEFKEIQGKLDFIINEDTKNHIFDENGIITSNPGSRFIISLISGNPATEKVLDFWWNLRILIHKKTGTVSEESKKEVRKSWLELHKRLEDDESIVNSLEEIIQPAKPEIKEFSDALDAISSEEKSVDDYKEEILMELIEQILFFSGELETSKADRKKLMAAFVFDREALKKYGKVLSVFYTSGRGVSDDAAVIIKMAKSLGKNIKIENLSLKQLEKQFFKIQEVHRYTLETYPFWAEMASIIRERKAIGDIERKMLNPIINHYGDLLMLDFK